ncbi:recombination regulator RecX [Salicibibacter kimchii]|uniref:Regulatory protein RecX n=1 Tax=Salicibibacter kimchii TaxID=2099786 RepID=A0A345C361_9BACI|nr:recombination regulator RecX [Salicibibacter kimchii]AXF57642.1 recombination regulator RecX [Salicibibacter kimchii]
MLFPIRSMEKQVGDHIKISRITTQKQNAERYNLYVADENGERFACGVHESLLVRWALAKDKEITTAELDEIMQEDSVEKANKKALYFLAKRMRTEAEVREKLQDDEVPGDHIETVIQRMKDRAYINDKEYAHTYMRTMMTTSDKGPGSIRRYLHEKGVGDPAITEALEEYDEQKQIDVILKVIEKKEKTTTKDSQAMKKKKLTDALLRKGFQQSTIAAAFEAHDFSQDANDEWQALHLQAEKAANKLKRRYEQGKVRQKLKEQLYKKGFSLAMIDEYLETLNEERR